MKELIQAILEDLRSQMLATDSTNKRIAEHKPLNLIELKIVNRLKEHQNNILAEQLALFDLLSELEQCETEQDYHFLLDTEHDDETN